MLGLGAEAVIPVPCDEGRRMRPAALAEQLARCESEGQVVMAVVATAGTTDFGSIDPLPEIADLCEAAGVWMHVDAAYGCGLLVSRRRPLLDGIERADSVTVDYHKSFFQPVSSSAVLVRDRGTLRHVTYYADYLNPARAAESAIPNQVDKIDPDHAPLRRAQALDDPAGDGRRRYRRTVRRGRRPCRRRLATAGRRPPLRGRRPPQLSTLVFRYVPALPDDETGEALTDQANLHAREALFASGDAIVAGTVVDGRHYLKFTLLNPETTLADIAAVLELIAGHAERHLSAHSPLSTAQAC